MRTVKVLAMKCIVAVMGALYAVLKLLPVRDKAVFISRQTDGVSVDFQLIIDELDRRSCGWETVVLARRMKKTAPGAVAYGFHVLRQMYHLATSKAALIDGYCIPVCVLNHKKSLRIIQIWHAIGCMKKFGYAMIGEEEGSSEDVARIMKKLLPMMRSARSSSPFPRAMEQSDTPPVPYKFAHARMIVTSGRESPRPVSAVEDAPGIWPM